MKSIHAHVARILINKNYDKLEYLRAIDRSMVVGEGSVGLNNIIYYTNEFRGNPMPNEGKYNNFC